jgi:hypothetical protein
MDSGDKWVFLNGNVGFGDHHHQIAEQLADHLKLDPMKKGQISNYLLVGAAPTGLGHDIAYGHFEDNHPQIWRSNIDRNHVWDAVMNAKQKMDEVQTPDRLSALLEKRRPWFVAESGQRVVGEYGQVLNEILLGIDRRSVRHGYMMKDGRVLEHFQIAPEEPQEAITAPKRGRVRTLVERARAALL